MVEGWRGAPWVGPSGCSPFPPGVPHSPDRESVSNPRHVERSRRFSHTPLSCPLHPKGYLTYLVGSAFSSTATSATSCRTRTTSSAAAAALSDGKLRIPECRPPAAKDHWILNM